MAIDASGLRVCIVAGGPSAGSADWDLLPDECFVLAVNGAIRALPRCDGWFSLDWSPGNTNSDIVSAPRLSVRYWQAVHKTPMQDVQRRYPHIEWLRTEIGDGPFNSKFGMPSEGYDVTAGNSAVGALQLALSWRPERVALFGVDASGVGHWYDGPQSSEAVFKHIPDWMASLDCGDVEVVDASPSGGVRCFPKMQPNDALRWLGE